jgi:hypothetical protein
MENKEKRNMLKNETILKWKCLLLRYFEKMFIDNFWSLCNYSFFTLKYSSWLSKYKKGEKV